MTRIPQSEPSKPVKVTRAQWRDDRLKAALKANMAKRKAQAQARSGDTRAGMTGADKAEE